MAAHRYWRIWIVTSPSGSITGFAEIELRETAGGTDRTGSGTASASAVNATYPPSASVDNSNSTFWTTYNSGVGSPPWWWQYDFGAGNAFDIKEIYIVPRQDGFHTEAPGSFNWEWSDDGSSWTTQFIASGITWTATPQTFSVITSQTVRVTQEVIELVAQPTDTRVLVTQEVAEVVELLNPLIRATQEVVEAIIEPSPLIRVTQEVYEAIIEPVLQMIRSTQEVIEVIINTSEAENPSTRQITGSGGIRCCALLFGRG